MSDNKLSIYTATILILAIISQIVSYMAVDRIIARTLSQSEQRVYITVSGNEAETVEEVTEIGRNNTPPVDVKISMVESTKPEQEPVNESYHQEGILTAAAGVNYFNGQKETFYNLPMTVVIETARQKIEGMENAEAWIRSDGAKMLGEYIMCAACYDVHPYGSTLQSSMGECIVVDTGGFALTNPNQIDIATAW